MKTQAGNTDSAVQGEELCRKAIHVASRTVDVIVVAILALLFVLGCYGLWDSHNVATQANATRWQPYKPVQPDPISFHELQQLNPDVISWLELYGTGIDYPVCYNEDMDKYLTRNARGEHSLTGALFLDKRNTPDFSDFSTIVYGHHMDAEVMFGPLSRFADKNFFEEHEYGNLFVQGIDHGLHVFAYVKADAYDRDIYKVAFGTQQDRQAYLDLLMNRALNKRSIDVGPNDHIAVLSTCSSESTNARNLLICKICDETFENTFVEWPNTGTGIEEVPSFLGIPWFAWVLMILWWLLLLLLLARTRKRKKAEEAESAALEDVDAEADEANEEEQAAEREKTEGGDGHVQA